MPAEQAESSTRIGLDFLPATLPAASDSVKQGVTPRGRTAPAARQRVCGLRIVVILLLWATRNVG